MENQKQQPNGTKPASTNPAVDELVSKVMESMSQEKIQLPARMNMKLPITYEQFRTLVKMQAERIMLLRGRPAEYMIDEKIEAVMRHIYKFTQSDNQKGIALVGKIGCGKTLIMSAYIRVHNELVRLSNGRLQRERYTETTSSRLFRDLQDRDLFNRLCYDPLFIDELGREPKFGKNFGNETAPVIELIFERWTHGTITHCTSNFSLEDLSSTDLYGAIAGDRIRDMFEFILMSGDGRRGK